MVLSKRNHSELFMHKSFAAVFISVTIEYANYLEAVVEWFAFLATHEKCDLDW
jgi:hypothetical protein